MNARGLAAATSVELRKTVRSRVPLVTALIVVIGIAAICLSTAVAATSGSAEIVAKLGPVVAAGGWAGYLSAALQVIGAGAAGASGILLSWSFGREFGEGTITGLFALPVTRAEIAVGKFASYLAWSVVIALAVTAVILGGGVAAGFGTLSASDLSVAVRLPALVVLTALMALPVAWVATVSRGLLGGIAATIVLVVSAQVLVFSGSGPWFPPAAPALWAVHPDATGGIAVAVGLLLPAVFGVLTVVAWRRLQLDH
jgi:ABC-2 type transport system permease protein